jgi:hypothetical protein
VTDGQLNADVESYLHAAGLNVPPPVISSDSLVMGGTPVEQLLRALGAAANASDAADNAESAEQHAERDAQLNEAAAQFSAQDEESTKQLNNFADQSAAQMTQQLPQLATGIASSLAGALGGVLQPMTQLPQQLAQGAQQAMQTAMGMAQQFNTSPSTTEDGVVEDPDAFGDGESDFAGAGSDVFGNGGPGSESRPGDGGAVGLTTPTAMLGPPPVPSAATSPSSAPVMSTPPPAPAAPATMHSPGMAGMPMIPPGAMRGTEGASNTDKPDAKRLSLAPVKNGAPVQGRITVPPTAPQVVKNVDGKPVATRRIVVPNNRILNEIEEDYPHRP